jgi:transposase
MFRPWRQSSPVRELGERVERLESELGRRDRQIASLEGQLRERDARIAALEKLLEEARRAGKRQAAPFSKNKPKRDPKKPGRKPGSRYGRQAVRPTPAPDKTFQAPCPGRCPCGGKVGVEGSIDLYQVDIPPIKPETWRFVVGHGHCEACGRRVRGEHPLLTSKAFEVGTVHFGPRLLAFAAFLKMICGVSYDKIRLGLGEMLGFPLARSTLCRAMQRLARRAEPTRDALVEALRASPVVYADETGWRLAGRLGWLWVFTNRVQTVYQIMTGRGFEEAASVLGKDFAGILGVDGWAPYRRFTKAELQTCYNHLLHRCSELLETATRGAVRFPRAVKAILQQALELRDRRDAGQISLHGLRVAKGRLQAKMRRLLSGNFANPGNRRLAKHLRRYLDALFVFVDRPEVEATNHLAEQAIRLAVVNRKTCGGGNRTPKGAHAQSVLMSVLQSCRHAKLHMIDVVTAILRTPGNIPVGLITPPKPAADR